jgi:hypothetical protein
MVIPEDGKLLKKSYLADEDRKAASKAAADGAPPGFPTGEFMAAVGSLRTHVSLQQNRADDALCCHTGPGYKGRHMGLSHG